MIYLRTERTVSLVEQADRDWVSFSIPKCNNHPPLQPVIPFPRQHPMYRPHIHQHYIALRMHEVEVLVQIRRHRRAANPHDFHDVLREEETDRNEGEDDARGAAHHSDRPWESCAALAEVGEEGVERSFAG